MPSTVVFFISGHGFGHASRQVEIIHALSASVPELRVLVRSAVDPALLHRTLTVPFELRPGPCDTGIAQTSSIQHDDAATVDEAMRFYGTYDARVSAEVSALAADRVSLVVGDIAPLAFEVGARMGVPGVAIANFTWDWIYETHPDLMAAAPWLVPLLRASYAKATLALELPFAAGFEVFPAVRRLPLVARRPTRTRADTRAHFGLAADRAAVLISFGGYGLPDLDWPAVDCLRDWTVVTTDRIAAPAGARPPGVRVIPEVAFLSSGFRYEDLVAAVDVVLTKPGYGILAECISTRTAMLYTSRGTFREYAVLTREMPRFVRSRFISHDDLLGGRWARALDAILVQPPAPEAMATDGAAAAARELTRLLGASTSG